jgi:hypothetical protein
MPKPICRNCGAAGTVDEIRTRHPGAMTCCPERETTIRKVAGITEFIQSGPLQMGDQWPGVYLKGQDALQASAILGRLKGKISNAGYQMAIDELAELLGSCYVENR